MTRIGHAPSGSRTRHLSALAAVVVAARCAQSAVGDSGPWWTVAIWSALSVLIMGGAYAWAALRYPRRVVLLACALVAVHPLLLRPTPDGVLSLAWTALLWARWAGHRPVGVRMGLAIVVGLCVAPYLVLRHAGPTVDVSVWRFWELAPSDADMRTVLVNYFSRGGLYGLALVGACFAVRDAWRAWLVPAALVGLTWAASLLEPYLFTPSAVAPVLCLLAAIGFWRVYDGLGRTSGHGILAIDPVKEGRAPAGPTGARDA